MKRFLHWNSKLYSLIIGKYGSSKNFVEKLGKTQIWLDSRLLNSIEFTYEDIVKISSMLGLSCSETWECFFEERMIESQRGGIETR